MEINKTALIRALQDPDFSDYYRLADETRKQHKGEQVHIRALLEFSNYCSRSCAYCGLNCKNTSLPRFRMTPEEIISQSLAAVECGYRTIVLQSGEDKWYTTDILCDIVREIKKSSVFITLSCGEKSASDLVLLKQAGADRYLLKHETSSEKIYSSLHPCGTLASRIQCLKDIKSAGFETGSGFMIGLPDQTLDVIADDILLLKELDCDMAGIGPFLPHPATPLKSHPAGDPELCKRAVALTRIALPEINLPVTTALSVSDKSSASSVFSGGANVIMQKITPDKYRRLYEIYPTPEAHTNLKADRVALEEKLRSLGKIPV